MLTVPSKIDTIHMKKGEATIDENNMGADWRLVSLPADQDILLEIKLD